MSSPLRTVPQKAPAFLPSPKASRPSCPYSQCRQLAALPHFPPGPRTPPRNTRALRFSYLFTPGNQFFFPLILRKLTHPMLTGSSFSQQQLKPPKNMNATRYALLPTRVSAATPPTLSPIFAPFCVKPPAKCSQISRYIPSGPHIHFPPF